MYHRVSLLHPPLTCGPLICGHAPPPLRAQRALPAAWRRLPDPCQRVGPKLRAGERAQDAPGALALAAHFRKRHQASLLHPVTTASAGQISPALRGPGCLRPGGPSPASARENGAPAAAASVPRSPTPGARRPGQAGLTKANAAQGTSPVNLTRPGRCKTPYKASSGLHGKRTWVDPLLR